MTTRFYHFINSSNWKNKPYFVISEMVKQSPTSQPERNMGRSARSSVTKSPKMNGHTGGNYSSFLLKLANPKDK